MPTLADRGYLNPSPAIRHPHKKPKGGELTEAQTTYNKAIRGVHGIAQRANALLKKTFAVLQNVSLDPDVSATPPKPPSSCSTSNTTASSPAATQRDTRLPGMAQ
jgi:DDE superfamily endonuclease